MTISISVNHIKLGDLNLTWYEGAKCGMNSAEFLRKMESAVREFYTKDAVLVTLETERPIAHRMALYLEPLFEESDVDCEYNRYGRNRIKQLEHIRECDPERKTDRIFPDIVIHERMSEDRNNVAVIEIKPRAEMEDCDRMKLELMTRTGDDAKYEYEYGLFLGFETMGCKWILFVDGRQNSEGKFTATDTA